MSDGGLKNPLASSTLGSRPNCGVVTGPEMPDPAAVSEGDQPQDSRSNEKHDSASRPALQQLTRPGRKKLAMAASTLPDDPGEDMRAH
jgi:hypothetical protein